MNSVMNFGLIDQIVAVGSVDGVCTAAAVLRLTGRSNAVGLVFTQAFTVDKIDMSSWEPNRKVAFVDLAVNNRDAQMTKDFVNRLKAAGHEIVAIIDEHNREDWEAVLGSFDGLMIEPQSQDVEGSPKSSGDLLYRAVGQRWDAGFDQHLAELLFAADQGDKMNFDTWFGSIVNKAVKSAIADDSRRVYLARHIAGDMVADEKIFDWISEYEVILANHDRIVASKVDLGDGIVRVVATGLSVDMTTLMGRLYGEGARVVVLEGESYNKVLGRKTVQISFGTNDKNLDLLALLKRFVPTASGFAQKVNVDRMYERVALLAIRTSFLELSK